MAQSLTLNQIKYWDYRHQLLERYVLVGSDPGESLPAEAFQSEHNLQHFSDGTIHLGWYMGVLATEYQLSLKSAYLRTGEGKEINKQETLLELYYALKALERLDRGAEKFYDPNSEGELNGFFIRDDAGSHIEKSLDIKYLRSDYVGEDKKSNEMSQDQVIHLLLGLILVRDCIPEMTQVKGESLNGLATTQAIRILEYMRSNKWLLTNPILKKSNGKNEPVARGHEAFIYSQGYYAILKELQGGKENAGKGKVGLFNKIFWSSMRSRVNPTYFKNDNRHMAMALSATSNGFKRNTYRKLMKRAKPHEWYLYPMLNLYLHQGNRQFKNPKKSGLVEVQSLLDRAPAGGPSNPESGAREEGWCVANMFFRDYQRQREGREYKNGFAFNGLDYMLMYNLFLMHRSGLFIDGGE